MTIYAYARVSTEGQTLAAQDAALRAAGAAKVYSETASGAKTDRAGLAGESLTDIARSYNVSHTTIGRLTSCAPAQ
jgi:DNA invertase Pin-like site-specific DNA recombinase